jgi:hypothetical protein
MENLDLIVSPTKLFEGTNVPRTSDQKSRNRGKSLASGVVEEGGKDKENLESSVNRSSGKRRRQSTISSKTK